MLKKDYILQLVEQLSGFIVHITKLKEAHQYDEAVAETDRALRDVVGLGSESLLNLPTADLASYLSLEDGVVWQEKVLFAATVLVQEADVCDKMGDDLGRDRRNLAALDMVLEVGKLIPNYGLPEYAPDIDEQVEQVGALILPDHTAVALLNYYLVTGQYDTGEDFLFQWRADAQDVTIVVNAGQQFYAHLLNQDDEDLEEGGLPRDEVAAGLSAFLNGEG